ncbi:MAG: hypothetical protein NTZ93_05025 [Candidatus Beckwithbacteria bacterium]|nr:hypothetical protein [Candidatus Beckwithbacteria bacterium]
MKKLLCQSLLLAIILNFFLVTSVIAGGGRMVLMHNSTNTYSVKEDIISAQVFLAGSNNRSPSSGERVEFRIKNPQAGDNCVTAAQTTDNLGTIYATCYANSQREMEVYLYSLDKQDESSIYLLHFLNPPKPSLIPTPSPSFVIVPRPSLSPSPSLQPSFNLVVQSPETKTIKNEATIPQLSPLKKVSYFFTNIWGRLVGFFNFIKK